MLESDNMIFFAELPREMRRGIEKLYERHAWYSAAPVATHWEEIEGRSWLTMEQMCMMHHRLRVADDEVEIFPRGKAATVQRVDDLITRAMQMHVRSRGAEAGT